MKKIFILFIFTSAFFVSCNNDLLEPFTPGSLTEDVAITASSDLQRVMNSTYGLLANREDIIFSSVFTDEVGIGFANGGQGINDNYVFFLNTSSDSPTTIWNSSYYALSRANRVIAFADKLTPVDAADKALISRLKAEALVVRALCHIKLLSYFSPDPKSNDALAAVLADKIILSSDAGLPRSKNGEFYTSIHSDLDAALGIFNSLTTSPYTGATVTLYPNKNLAKALKARAYALKGDYVNAETWANDVINTSGIVLANDTNYNSIFHTDSEPANTEVIFRLKRTLQQSGQGSNIGNGYASVNTTINGSPFFEIGRSLYNILDSKPTDIRRSTIVHPTSLVDPNYATSADYRNTDKLIIGKHRGSGSVGLLNSDFKIVRLSEMYFIKAEARVAAGDLAGAAIVIKSLLDKRFPVAQVLPVYTSATNAWKDILNQRRLEFAFEGYRFIDLKRLGVLAGVGIDRNAADYSSSSANYPAANPVNLPITSTKFALPIPQSELNANPGIQQNPGY